MSAIDQINQGGTTYEIVPEIAELFSIEKTYRAGDHVIYGAGWYTFKTDKYAGAWDDTKVDGPFKVTNELSSLKSDLTAFAPKEDMLKAFPVDTASGSIASFSDGAELPLKSLTVDIEPIQDLHGYDKPWAGGAGKNKANIDGATNLTGMALSNGVLANTLTDSKNRPSLYVATYRGSTLVEWLISVAYSPTVGRYSGLYTINNTDFDRIRIWHSGSTQDLSSFIPCSVSASGGYVLSINFLGVAPDVVGGFSFKEVQFEAGTTASAFAPYSNICPISGHTQAVVTRTGVNVWDEEWELGIYSLSDGLPVPNASSIRGKNRIVAKPSTDYYCNNNNIRVLYYDESDNYLGFVGGLGIKTTPTNCAYIRMYLGNDYGMTYNHDVCINYPSTDHDYHPYSGQSITIQLGQTVYGGRLDVTNGVLTVDRAMVDLGSLYWGKYNTQADRWRFGSIVSDIARAATGSQVPNIVCEVYKTVSPNDTYVGVTGISSNASSSSLFICDLSISETADFMAAINGKKVVYPLATPITVQLTPQEVRSLLGSNNVWADSGDSEVTYRADPTLYIGRLTEPDADMVADANITSGQYFMVGNTLYKATANIASGATISPNVNCTRKSLSEALNELNA